MRALKAEVAEITARPDDAGAELLLGVEVVSDMESPRAEWDGVSALRAVRAFREHFRR